MSFTQQTVKYLSQEILPYVYLEKNNKFSSDEILEISHN